MNNIFNFATSELSQDAFLCYLANFAHKDYRDEYPALNKCAFDFLKFILNSENDLVDKIEVTRLEKQYYNIDVFIEVNNQYNIILEDKTFTSQHSEQIERYEKLLEDQGKKHIITVYYKIIGQAHPENVNKNITRTDMLQIMEPYINKTSNTIFLNYYNFLFNIKEQVNLFKVSPINEWEDNQYRGFFKHITDKTNPVINLSKSYGWGYVPNPTRGFNELWWYFMEE